MPYCREYFPSDALKIINQSENKPGTSGKNAHAISRHLRNSAKGSNHHGVELGIFLKRWEDNPYTDSGDTRINSGWLGKGDMALLLTNLLNSPVAQAALSALDKNATRASVTAYFTDAEDFFGNRFGGAVAELRTMVQSPIFQYHPVHERNPFSGQLKSIRVQKAKHKGVLRIRDIVGAVAVLDNMGGSNPHLQTFYPLFYTVGKSFSEFSIGTCVKTLVDLGGGKLQTMLRIGVQNAGNDDSE